MDKVIAVNKANGVESTFTRAQWDKLTQRQRNIFTTKEVKTPKEVLELQKEKAQETETAEKPTQAEKTNETKPAVEKVAKKPTNNTGNQ